MGMPGDRSNTMTSKEAMGDHMTIMIALAVPAVALPAR
jgi:hypothetical protein